MKDIGDKLKTTVEKNFSNQNKAYNFIKSDEELSSENFFMKFLKQDRDAIIYYSYLAESNLKGAQEATSDALNETDSAKALFDAFRSSDCANNVIEAVSSAKSALSSARNNVKIINTEEAYNILKDCKARLQNFENFANEVTLNQIVETAFDKYNELYEEQCSTGLKDKDMFYFDRDRDEIYINKSPISNKEDNSKLDLNL